VLCPAAQVLTQLSRYSYSHGIAREDLLDERRVSITFRHSRVRAAFETA
jgi:hypothetical protein